MNNNNTGHNGRKRRTRANNGPRSVPPAPVTVTVHNPRALRIARSIVEGYRNRGFSTRVVGNPDGSVSVVNGS